MRKRTLVWAAIVLDVIAFPIIGLLATLGLAGMIEYGDPQPSALVVIARYAATFVLFPAAIIAAIASGALFLIHRDRPWLGIALASCPLLLAPTFFRAALA